MGAWAGHNHDCPSLILSLPLPRASCAATCSVEPIVRTPLAQGSHLQVSIGHHLSVFCEMPGFCWEAENSEDV